jgi:hypothetical protein
MDQQEWLARQFEEQRPHLQAVAYRMLGSLSEADDAVQDAWLRLSRRDTREVENLRGWLHGQPFSIAAFTIANGTITEIDFLADPERIDQLDLTVLGD